MGKKSRSRKAVESVERRPGDNSGLAGIIGELISNQQYEEAYRAAAVLVEQDPLNPDAHAVMGLLLSRTDRILDALRHYELAIRLGRATDPTLYVGVATSAVTAQLMFHAVTAARQGTLFGTTQQHQVLFKAIIDAGQQQLRQLIGTHDVPEPVAEQAMLLIERSARARQESDFGPAQERAVEATQLAPQLPVTWYNLALVHWTLEEVPAAIAACEMGLKTLHDENTELLAAIVRLQAFSGQEEAAQATLQRLAATPVADTAGRTDIAKGYAALDDDQRVYDLLSGTPSDEELPLQLFVLGVAAANLGKREEARSAWRSLVRDKHPYARAFSEIMARNEKPPTPGARFSYFVSTDLMPGVALDNLVDAARRQANPAGVAEVAARYPKVVAALCEAFIMRIVDPRIVVQILLQVPDAATVDAIRGYAGGRLPTDYDRLFAHIALRGAGLIDASEPASVWLGGRRQHLHVPALALGAPPARAYSSEVGAMLREAGVAQHENNLIKAIELYRRVLEVDPANAEAEHNLGTAFMLSGRIDEGEAHLKRSLDNDGNYAMARCNLATLELSRERVAEANSYMQPLDERTQMSLEEIVAYLRTKSDIARAAGDAPRSEELLHCLLTFDRDNAVALGRLGQRSAAPVSSK